MIKTYEVTGRNDSWSCVSARNEIEALDAANSYAVFRGYRIFTNAKEMEEGRPNPGAEKCVISMKIDGVHLYI